MLIPDVLENFDTVEKGSRTFIDDKRKESVVITKSYSDGSIIMANAVVDENTLEIKTIVVKKPTEVSPTHAKATSDSLLSPGLSDLTGSGSLAPNSQGTQSVTNNI